MPIDWICIHKGSLMYADAGLTSSCLAVGGLINNLVDVPPKMLKNTLKEREWMDTSTMDSWMMVLTATFEHAYAMTSYLNVRSLSTLLYLIYVICDAFLIFWRYNYKIGRPLWWCIFIIVYLVRTRCLWVTWEGKRKFCSWLLIMDTSLSLFDLHRGSRVCGFYNSLHDVHH